MAVHVSVAIVYTYMVEISIFCSFFVQCSGIGVSENRRGLNLFILGPFLVCGSYITHTLCTENATRILVLAEQY